MKHGVVEVGFLDCYLWFIVTVRFRVRVSSQHRRRLRETIPPKVEVERTEVLIPPPKVSAKSTLKVDVFLIAIVRGITANFVAFVRCTIPHHVAQTA